MGKVTIELNEVDHKKLKMICINNDVKIKDYVLDIVQREIAKDIKNLDIFQEWTGGIIKCSVPTY